MRMRRDRRSRKYLFQLDNELVRRPGSAGAFTTDGRRNTHVRHAYSRRRWRADVRERGVVRMVVAVLFVCRDGRDRPLEVRVDVGVGVGRIVPRPRGSAWGHTALVCRDKALTVLAVGGAVSAARDCRDHGRGGRVDAIVARRAPWDSPRRAGGGNEHVDGHTISPSGGRAGDKRDGLLLVLVLLLLLSRVRS